MSTDSAVATGYRPYTTNGHVLTPAVTVHFPRERVHSNAGPANWSNLPARCFGTDRQLPEWLIRPWHLLQSAAQRRHSLAGRLADLNEVGRSLDELFTLHLPRQADWFQSPEAAGLSLSEVMPRWVDELIGEATGIFLYQLRPDLLLEGIHVTSMSQLDEWQRGWLHHHFMQRIYPLLTPLAVDPGRPFPYISSDSLNLLVELRRVDSVRGASPVDRNSLFARVKVPRATPRLVAVPTHQNGRVAKNSTPTLSDPMLYVSSADLVRHFVHHLFPGLPVRQVYLFRVVRGEQPLPGVTHSSTRPRRQEDKPVVRLDVEQRMGEPVLNWLLEHLRMPRYALAQHDRLLDWSCLPYLAQSVEAKSVPALG